MVPDNLMVLTQNGGQTKLQAKGRLIFPSEKILTFDSGKYSERAGVGAEYEDKAPVQAEVLKLLKASQKLTVNEMANTLGKDKGQVSIICTKLSEDGKIKTQKSQGALGICSANTRLLKPISTVSTLSTTELIVERVDRVELITLALMRDQADAPNA